MINMIYNEIINKKDMLDVINEHVIDITYNWLSKERYLRDNIPT